MRRQTHSTLTSICYIFISKTFIPNQIHFILMFKGKLMEVFSVLLGIIVAAAAGFYFGRRSSSDSQEKTKLETELKQKNAELEAFQNKVSNHFEKTANLFNQVSDSYQSLYEHMAHSSSQLCASQTFQSLPSSKSKPSLNDAGEALAKNFVHKTDKEAVDVFDANNLYNAHDYRNTHEITNKTVVEEPLIGLAPANTNKVVDIETAKEDKKEPPLDYAVKKEGVINHNSLNMDGVKSS